jgi:hypothetical protein
MEFGNPWMLLGLLLALLPAAVHLFGRRRAPVVPFAALAFVLARNPKQARALRVSEWLLVAVRTAAVALAVLALSKPMLPVLGGSDGMAVGEGPVALVIVIDDSLSTFAKVGGESLFERARAQAIRLTEQLPLGSKVAAVASGKPARALVAQATSDRSSVIDALRRLDHHPRKDDAERALRLADEIVTYAGLPDRRVVVLTDLQQSGWREIRLPWREPAGKSGTGQVTWRVDKLEPQTRENTAIVDAVATPASERGPNQVRIDVAVAHHGRSAFSGYLTVRTGEREVKSLLQIRPGEALRRSYFVPASAGVADLSLPPDGLPTDDQRLVRLDAAGGVKVALVNGAPRPVARDDEVFFAARALELAGQHAGELAIDVLQLPGLTPAALRDYDVIALANPGELPQTLVAGLQQAVRDGKGVLVTVGDNLPADAPAWLRGLLPVPLHGERVAPVRLRAVAKGDPPAPPAVQRLRDTLAAALGTGLDDAHVQRYALVQPSLDVRRWQVLAFSDGAPALLVVPHGRGWLGMWLTTLDRDWTDAPLQPGFLPLLREVCMALAGDRGLERKGTVEVGERAVLVRDERADALEVRFERDRGGQARVVLKAADQRGRNWQIDGLDDPGLYTATELGAGVPLTSRNLITVPPPGESDLAVLTQGPLSRAPVRATNEASQRPRAPGWVGALLVLMALLVFEGVVLARGAYSVRIGRDPGAMAEG